MRFPVSIVIASNRPLYVLLALALFLSFFYAARR
jgi:hypothetical protein